MVNRIDVKEIGKIVTGWIRRQEPHLFLAYNKSRLTVRASKIGDNRTLTVLRGHNLEAQTRPTVIPDMRAISQML